MHLKKQERPPIFSITRRCLKINPFVIGAKNTLLPFETDSNNSNDLIYIKDQPLFLALSMIAK